MEKKRYSMMLFALALIVISALTCNGSRDDTEDQGTTAVAPTLEAVPSAISSQGSDAPTNTSEPKPTDTPGPTNTPGPSGCSDDSKFIADITIPDDTEMRPGQAFTKVWRIQNNGSCTWTTSYQFAFVEGEQMGVPQGAHLIQDVPPGATYDMSVTFAAPTIPGTYRSTWQLRRPDGALFGTQPYVQIVVPAPTAIPTPAPTPTEESEVADLKEELYFTLGGGGASDFSYLCFDSIPGANLPAIVGHGRLQGVQMGGAITTRDDGVLCLYGFPFDEEIAVDLYTPPGELVGSGLFRIEEDKRGSLRTFQIHPELAGSPMDLGDPELEGLPIVGSASVVSDVAAISISIWLPTGLPGGQWYAVARSDSTHAEGSFVIVGPDYPTVSSMPGASIDPFKDYRCTSYFYSPDDQVVLYGTSFDPNKRFPLGIYYLTEKGKGIDILGVLVYGQMVQTDSQGNFSTVVDIRGFETVAHKASLLFEHPTYFVVADPPDDGYRSDTLSFFIVSQQ